MKRTFGTPAFAAKLKDATPEYRAVFAEATLESTHAGIWFDADHPALQKYRPPRPLKLAGDRFAELAKLVGADRLTRSISRVTGKGCRCDARRRWLNRLHARLLPRTPDSLL